jgi:hypothetical protein
VAQIENALAIAVMIGVRLIVSFLANRICSGNLVRVQLKTVVRIAHQAGLHGTSQTTIPGLSPVASASAGNVRVIAAMRFTVSRQNRFDCRTANVRA